MDDLALQVRLVDDVEVDDAERADASGGEVEQRRGAEPARSHHQHLGGFQPLLPGGCDFRDDQMPAVPANLVHAQLGPGLDQGGQGHSGTPSTDITDTTPTTVR